MDMKNAEKAAEENPGHRHEELVTEIKLDKTELPLSPQPSSRSNRLPQLPRSLRSKRSLPRAG